MFSNLKNRINIDPCKKKKSPVSGSHEIFNQTLYIAKHQRSIHNTDLKSRLTSGPQRTGEHNQILSLASQISILFAWVLTGNTQDMVGQNKKNIYLDRNK